MGPIGHQRIAQRFPVATTPIRWKVPKRRGLTARSKPVPAEGAIIELSIMGAAIVAPMTWRPIVGSRVQIEWNGLVGMVIIRREMSFRGSTTMAMYGVEHADNSSPLAKELFERLVVDAASEAVARDATALIAQRDASRAEASSMPSSPAVWTAPHPEDRRADVG